MGGGVFLVAVAGTLVVGSIAISVAWLFYHPLFAIAVLGGCLLLAFLCWKLFRKKQQPELHSSGLEYSDLPAGPCDREWCFFEQLFAIAAQIAAAQHFRLPHLNPDQV